MSHIETTIWLFFLQGSDVSARKNLQFTFIAIGACKIMKFFIVIAMIDN